MGDDGYDGVENLHRFERIDEDRLNDFDDGDADIASNRHVSMTSHHSTQASHYLPSMTSHVASVASVTSSRSASISPKLSGPESMSPSVRMSVRQISATPLERSTRSSSVTVIELRSGGDASPTFIDDDTDDVDADAAEVNTTIFV